MSSYARIYINSNEIFSYRNWVPLEIQNLFTSDEFLHYKEYEAWSYASNWLIGSYDLKDEEIEDIEVQAYQTTAAVLKDRLSVLGFDELLAKRVVKQVIAKEIKDKINLIEYYGENIRNKIKRELDDLHNLDYETWKTSVGRYIATKKDNEQLNWIDRDPFSLFYHIDQRILLRIIVDQMSENDSIILDIHELVEGGWMGASDNFSEDQEADLELDSSPPIIITEGKYDIRVLRGAIEILKPHLAGRLCFLDYEVRNEGGASAAVRMLKSFAAAGISNRIIVLFDNDSAAYEAVMSLRGIKLPSHYAVKHYPNLDLANSYPTLGPQGATLMDVNRLAGSIELYLGKDVLSSLDDNGNLTPVQWKGYMNKVQTYQGEIMNKSGIQDAFQKKLNKAKTDASMIKIQDWSGLALILDMLIDTLSATR